MGTVEISWAALIGLIIGPAVTGWIAAGKGAVHGVQKGLNGTRAELTDIRDMVVEIGKSQARTEERSNGFDRTIVAIQTHGCNRLAEHLAVLADIHRREVDKERRDEERHDHR